MRKHYKRGALVEIRAKMANGPARIVCGPFPNAALEATQLYGYGHSAYVVKMASNGERLIVGAESFYNQISDPGVLVKLAGL